MTSEGHWCGPKPCYECGEVHSCICGNECESLGEPFVCLDHEPVQHLDGKTPWCRVCGLGADGNEPEAANEPSEAQVEAAAQAIWERYAGHGLWETLPAARKAPFLKDARAALVAAAGAGKEKSDAS